MQGVRRASGGSVSQGGGRVRRSSRGAGMLTAILDNLGWIIVALCVACMAAVGALYGQAAREIYRDLRDVDRQARESDDLQW